MLHQSSLRGALRISVAFMFTCLQAAAIVGCSPQAPKAPTNVKSRTAFDLGNVDGGDWGSNCTMPGVAARALGNDFGDKLFARQAEVVVDPTVPTSNFEESLYIHGQMFRGSGGEPCMADATCGGGRICSCERDMMSGACARAGTCFAQSIDDMRENLNDKFHKWAGPSAGRVAPLQRVGYARAWDVDNQGQQRGDSDIYRDALMQAIRYSMGRDSIFLSTGSILGPNPAHLTPDLLFAFRTYLVSTLQVARIPAPRPMDPGHSSAVIVDNLMIADGLQTVPIGARLSCMAPEGVFSMAMDPCTPTRTLGYYAFAGTIWQQEAPIWGTDQKPNRVFQNLPATIPMPPTSGDLSRLYRKVPKPPAPIFGLSETSTIVTVAGSACLDSNTCRPLTPMEIMLMHDMMITRVTGAANDVPGVPAVTSTQCAILADDGLTYFGRQDAGGNCVGCTSNSECIQTYGHNGMVCYDSGARVGPNVYRTCVRQVGCTPSLTYDYSPWLFAQATHDATPLRTPVNMESYTCHIPMEVLPPAQRACAPAGLDVPGYGVYWCAHINAFGDTDPTGYFSGATGVQLREECGHDRSGL